ncbi:MAG: hypothetical protein NTV75_01290 [Bacteroidia bacterium]|nr:hypothetical protein [Bacteroidia bacterium]
MKTNLKLLSFIALLASACTTGNMITTGPFVDDAYFSPGDHAPVIVSDSPNKPHEIKRAGTISGIRQEEAGKIVDNYFSDKNSNNQANTLNDNQANNQDADQIDDSNNYINGYEEPEELDYTMRIRTFYNPYAYDPYWDSYYSPGFGFGWGLGVGALYGAFGYNNWYGGFGYGSYGYGGFGYGGFGYGGYYSPYYGGWGMSNMYWGNNYGYGNYRNGDYRDRYYGRQNAAGRGGASSMGLTGFSRNSQAGTYSGRNSISRSMIGSSRGGRSNTNVINGTNLTGSSRQAGTRYTVSPNGTKSAVINGTGQSVSGRSGQTLTNLRRTQSVGQSNGNVRTQGSTYGSSRYTPTYSRPRSNVQGSYNSGVSRQYARPQGSNGTYSPGSSSVGSTYNRGSSRIAAPSQGSRSGGSSTGSTIRSSYSTGQTPTYSAPARSNISTGGGGGGGSFSGGGNAGGGGGGGGGRRH